MTDQLADRLAGMSVFEIATIRGQSIRRVRDERGKARFCINDSKFRTLKQTQAELSALEESPVEFDPRDYEHWTAEVIRITTAFTDEQRARYKLALKLWDRYRLAMLELNLHPLTSTEISNRLAFLDSNERAMKTCGGDTPGNRAIYRARYPDKPPPPEDVDGLESSP